MSFFDFHFGESFAAALAIIAGAFVSEDAATITAATLASAAVLDTRISFLSAVAGLWAGDPGVYGAARLWKEKAGNTHWFSKTLASLEGNATSAPSEWPLAVSRFFPGTRLAAFVILTLWKSYGARLRATGNGVWQNVVRWEFWPAWIFYAPVTAMCAWLGIRYRGISLPTIANLNQKNGEIVGESKMSILHELMKSSPESTARTWLITAGREEERLARIETILETHGVSFPFVLKPDTAQRGAGFRKVQSLEDATNHLKRVTQPLVLQEYVEGPNEAGIFSYPLPGEALGRIFGITRKRFPSVTGDGVHSLEQLIQQDDRARFLKSVYVRRLGAYANRIPAAGEKVRLVEAGNHCQGCIFEDGWDLYSEDLRYAVDEISQKIPGFYVGRFDVRYTTDQALRSGTGFQIIELNGAAPEATNLCDPKNSLWTAYRTLYRQWKLIYAIGSENRKRGAVPHSSFAVWQDWRDFSSRACDFPIAD